MKLFKLKRKNIILVSLLAIAGFLGISSVAVNQAVKDTPVAEKAEADSTHNIYFAVSGTSFLTQGNTIKVSGNVGNNNTWIESGAMTLQGTCSVSSTTKLLFKGQYTERYGGLNGLKFIVYDGSTKKRELVIWDNGDWVTAGNITNYMFVFNGQRSYTKTNTIPSTSSESLTYYFVPPHSWFAAGGETFKLSCCFDQFEVGYIGGSKVGTFNGSEIWQFSYNGKTSLNYVVFNRCSSSGTWWNKSGYIAIHGSYSSGSANDIWVTPYGQANSDGWTAGSWQTNPKIVKLTSEQSPSNSTGRVFFCNTGTHWADNTGANKGCAVYAWGGDASPLLFGSRTAEATIYNISWFTDDNGTSYGYADIPTNVTGYKFFRITAVDNYDTSLGYDSDNTFTPDSFAYVRYGQSDGNYISTGSAKDNVAGEALMTKVINAYNTCSSSVLNGYGAYSALNTNFYSHAEAVKSKKATSMGGSSMSFEDHFLGMASRSGTNGQNALHNYSPFNLLGGENNFSTIIIIISSSVALLSVTALSILVIRKRKSKED